MRAIEILKNEHRVIEKVVDSLERIADRGAEQGRLDALAARRALDFFHSFVDGCHRNKEEIFLFPLMKARGLPCGPTGVMRDQHDRGLSHLWAMAAFLPGAADGEADALEQFVRQVRIYVQFLREHIENEDNRLYVDADRALTAADQRELLKSFDLIESHQVSAGKREGYLRLADELAEHLRVTDPADAVERGR
jgi:hemerythrin-like domain-containing protein